jgi:hypothetical protein
MAITNGNYITPSPIPNATVLEKLRDGALYAYLIAPNDGYLLHDNTNDVPVWDEFGNETGEMTSYFVSGDTTTPASYDFTTTTQGEYKYTDENGNEITMPVTMIGAREFYTVPSNVVPSDQVLGGGDNDHEVM